MKDEAKLIEGFNRQMKHMINSKFLQRLKDGEAFSYDAFYLGVASEIFWDIGTGTLDFDEACKRVGKTKELAEARKQFVKLMEVATRAKSIEITFENGLI